MGVTFKSLWRQQQGAPVPPDPPPPTGDPSVFMADAMHQKSGFNTKSNYLQATYGKTPEHREHLKTAMLELNPRIVREGIATGAGTPRTVQREYLQAILGKPTTRIKWGVSVGNTAQNADPPWIIHDEPNTPAGNANVRAAAIGQFTLELGELVDFWLPWCQAQTPPLALTDIIATIAGPNEIDAGYGSFDARRDTGPYWDRSARIFQDELKRMTGPTGPWGNAFAGIPILAGSTASDLTEKLWSAQRYAGWPDTTVPDPGAPGEPVWLPQYPSGTPAGTRYNPTPVVENQIQAWCQWTNPHLYQRGAPHLEVREMLAALGPIAAPINGARAPANFEECGYRTSGFDLNDNYVAQTGTGVPLKMKGRPHPHWAVATYIAKCRAVFFKENATYVQFELLDDPDPDPQHNGATSQEKHIGIIGTTTDAAMGGDGTVGSVATFVRSPAFHALRRFHNLIRDIGVDFTTTALPFTWTSTWATVADPQGLQFQFIRLQKRSTTNPALPGKHLLVVWRDVSVWNVDTQGPGSAPTIRTANIRLVFETAKTITVYQPNQATGPNSGSTTHGSAQVNAPILTGPTVVAAATPYTVPIAGDLKVLEIA